MDILEENTPPSIVLLIYLCLWEDKNPLVFVALKNFYVYVKTETSLFEAPASLPRSMWFTFDCSWNVTGRGGGRGSSLCTNGCLHGPDVFTLTFKHF